MTWEQRWMRRLIKAVAWASVFMALCAVLDFSPTWQLIAFAVTLSIVEAILDGLLPIKPTANT